MSGLLRRLFQRPGGGFLLTRQIGHITLIGVCGSCEGCLSVKPMRRVHASSECSGVGRSDSRRCFAFVCMLSALALALAERDALASCGDYVMVGGTHHDAIDQSAAGDRSPGGPRDLPVCSGRHCQRHIPLPPAPKPLVPASPQESACYVTGFHAESDGGASLVCEPFSLSPQAVLVPPNRPPRG